MAVHFQTEHWGQNTDDFLIIAESGPVTRRKLAGQLKRTFTVSTTDLAPCYYPQQEISNSGAVRRRSSGSMPIVCEVMPDR